MQGMKSGQLAFSGLGIFCLLLAFGVGTVHAQKESARPQSQQGVEVVKADALPLLLLADKTGREQPIVLVFQTSAGKGPRNLKILGQVTGVRFEQEFTVPKGQTSSTVLLRVPYVDTERQLELTVNDGQSVLARKTVDLKPVSDFVFYLFPSSHLCVAYENNMMVDHDDAAYVVGQAIHILEKYPEGVWTAEFAWGLKLYWDKHPEQRELIKKLVREGRLEVGGRFSPNIQDGQDEESLARQIAETQWWLEETFGKRAQVALDWDLPVLFPQASQLYKEGGLTGWITGAYFGFDEDKTQASIAFRNGSPFYKYVSPDGSAIPVLAPAKGLHQHYLNSNIVGEFGTNRNGGGLLLTVPGAMSIDNLQQVADLVRKAEQASSMNFLAGTAGMSDQSTPKERLYQQARVWNATFASPRIRFLSAGEIFKKAEESGKIVDRLDEDIPSWLRNITNALGVRQHSNEAAASLRIAETLAALDSLTLDSLYPRESLNAAWIELLHTQQHEQFETRVSPGGDVLDWSNANLDRAEEIAQSVANLAMRDLASRIKYDPFGQPVVVFNHLNWEARDLVSVKLPTQPGGFEIRDGSGRRIPVSVSDTPAGRKVTFLASAPPLGYASYYLASAADSDTGPRAEAGNAIENEFYKLTVDEKTGLIASLFDKRLGRDLVDPARPSGGWRLVWDDGGPAATWAISRPSGKVWLQQDYPSSKIARQASPLGQELTVRGPLLGDGEARFGEFREVRYRLNSGVDHLDISLRYAWGPDVKKTKRAWLMFDLLLALKETQATYGSAYSAVNYRQFPWDHSGLERIRTMNDWCDLYDPAAKVGVTLAGPSGLLELRPDGLSIALLSRHGSEPAETAIGIDGEHSFTYALRSHTGDWREANAVRFGAEHKAGVGPLLAVLGTPREGNYLPPRQSLLNVVGDHVVVTALKQTHDGQDLLLRLYETHGKPEMAELPDGLEHNISSISKSNLLEEVVEPLDEKATKHIELRPWQIASFRIALTERGSEIDPNWKRNWKAAPAVEIENSIGTAK